MLLQVLKEGVATVLVLHFREMPIALALLISQFVEKVAHALQSHTVEKVAHALQSHTVEKVAHALQNYITAVEKEAHREVADSPRASGFSSARRSSTPVLPGDFALLHLFVQHFVSNSNPVKWAVLPSFNRWGNSLERIHALA